MYPSLSGPRGLHTTKTKQRDQLTSPRPQIITMFNILLQTALLLSTALTGALAECVIPYGAEPLPNSITTGFAIQVQNSSYPVIHNRLMNLWQAGGGDQHLYLDPAGTPTSNLTLEDGVITRLPIRAVINGEVCPL